MTGVRHISDVHRQVCSVLCWARSDVSVLAQFLHYAHMWISSLGTHSWVVSWTLSHNPQVLYFISSHNGTLTRCGAQTNPSYLISLHMWPGAILSLVPHNLWCVTWPQPFLHRNNPCDLRVEWHGHIASLHVNVHQTKHLVRTCSD